MFVTSPLSADPSQSPIWRRPAWISLALLPLLLAWDFSGGDMKMAAIWGESDGFALRSNWWMVKIMHEGARTVGWVFLLTLLLGIWRPWGALRSLATADRASVFGSVLCALLSVTFIKGFSETSCPWDLQIFGGLAPYVSHWDFWQRRALLSCGPCFNRICFHGRLLWPETKQRTCSLGMAIGRVAGWLCIGCFTANARCSLHEPHAVDGMALLVSGLAQPPCFLQTAAPQKIKHQGLASWCFTNTLNFT